MRDFKSKWVVRGSETKKKSLRVSLFIEPEKTKLKNYFVYNCTY